MGSGLHVSAKRPHWRLRNRPGAPPRPALEWSCLGLILAGLGSGAVRVPLLQVEWRRLEWPLWALAVTSATLGVFWLPWQLPSQTPAQGESFALGFHNRIAVYSLAVAIASATVARLAKPAAHSALDWLSKDERLLPAWRVARAEYLVLGICTFVWINVLWAWGNYIVDPAWGDARVNIYNIDLLALGRRPYRDFMVIYGFSMIYLPYWLSTLTQGGLSFEQAYHVVLVVFVMAGFSALFVFLRALNLPERARPMILLLVLLSWTVFVTALAHGPLRYVSVPAALVLMHQAIRRPRGSRFSEALVGLASASVATFVVLGISPEMGLAVAFGSAAYAFALALAGRIEAALGTVAGLLVAVGGIVAVFPTYFLTVAMFSAGQYNFPVYPNAHSVTLVAAAVMVVPALLATALRDPGDVRSPLALALATGGGIMLVGAFGRAAPIHVACNGVVPLIAMFAVAAAWGRKPLLTYMGVYAVLQIVLIQISWWSNSYGTVTTAVQMRKIYDANPVVVAEWRNKWDERRAQHPRGKNLHWSSALPYPAELDQLAARGTIIQTSGGEWNLWLGRYLALQPDAPHEFFHSWTQGADTPEQIGARVRECKAARYILVPEYDFAAAVTPIDKAAYEQGVRRQLSWAMLFPVTSRVRFDPFFPNAMIVKELLATHKAVGRLQFFIYGPFILLERQSDAPAAAEGP